MTSAPSFAPAGAPLAEFPLKPLSGPAPCQGEDGADSARRKSRLIGNREKPSA